MELRDFFEKHPRAALGFSGGVDSAYLLYEGLRLGGEIRPVYVKSRFQPEFELEDAKRLCRELGVTLEIVKVDLEKEDGRILENGPRRCYFCKKALFGAVIGAAAAQGYDVVLDGNNASDDTSDRPGMEAARELRVLSPLRLCGLTKEEIRRRSREAGLFTWDKPAYACLATRIPTGCKIEQDALNKVERGEDALRAMGFIDFRLRIQGGGGKLQVTGDQLGLVIEKRGEILRQLHYFPDLTLDLRTRGSETKSLHKGRHTP